MHKKNILIVFSFIVFIGFLSYLIFSVYNSNKYVNNWHQLKVFLNQYDGTITCETERFEMKISFDTEDVSNTGRVMWSGLMNCSGKEYYLCMIDGLYFASWVVANEKKQITDIYKCVSFETYITEFNDYYIKCMVFNVINQSANSFDLVKKGDILTFYFKPNSLIP